MDFINSIFDTIKYILPALQYIFTIMLVHQIMVRIVKPFIRSHKNASGKFVSEKWAFRDRWVFMVPPVLGALCWFTVMGIMKLGGEPFDGSLLGFIMSGMGAQWIFHAVEHFSKERGIDIPSDFENNQS